MIRRLTVGAAFLALSACQCGFRPVGECLPPNCSADGGVGGGDAGVDGGGIGRDGGGNAGGDGGVTDAGGFPPLADATIFVMSKLPTTLYVLDHKTATLTRTINLFDGGSMGTSHHVVVDAAKTTAYVTMWNPARVVIVSLDTGKVARTIELSKSYFGFVDDAHDLRLAFGDKYLIVSLVLSEQLVVIDTVTQQIIQRMLRKCPPNYPGCEGVADGGLGWTLDEPNVKVLVTEQLRAPHSLRLNPTDGRQLAVGGMGTDSADVVIVNMVDDPTGPLKLPLFTIPLVKHDDANITSRKPSELTWTQDGKGIYCGTDFAFSSAFQTNQPRLWYVELASKKAYLLQSLDAIPQELVTTCGDQQLGFSAGDITYLYDITGSRRTAPTLNQQLMTGVRPHGMALSPDCRAIYVTNEGSDWTTKIALDDNNRLTTFMGTRAPEGIFIVP